MRISPENSSFQGAQDVSRSEGHATEPEMGRGGGPGGVVEHGAHEEDDPGTWEAPVPLGKTPVLWRPGDHSPTRPTLPARTADRPSLKLRKEQARGTEEGPQRGTTIAEVLRG
jgi:hypothetical protein